MVTPRTSLSPTKLRPEGRRVHIPLSLARAILAPLEAVALEVLPLTCGQLATFANDGTVTSFKNNKSSDGSDQNSMPEID